jgi:catechol 2,3-dioxygenase-like lactoylglutathione lyase family enzyme
MRLLHVALGVSSLARAQAFFGDLLGLAPSAPITLPVALGRDLFGLPVELQVINFKAEGVHLEVFVLPEAAAAPGPLAHCCLEVAGRAELLRRCERLGYPVRQAAKGDSVVVFVADLDGNQFELKERAG